MVSAFILTLVAARASRRTGLRWLRLGLGLLSVAGFALTLLSAVLAGLALPLLVLSHLQHAGGWKSGMVRWSSLLGEQGAATFNDWCSVFFLAIPCWWRPGLSCRGR